MTGSLKVKFRNFFVAFEIRLRIVLSTNRPIIVSIGLESLENFERCKMLLPNSFN